MLIVADEKIYLVDEKEIFESLRRLDPLAGALKRVLPEGERFEDELFRSRVVTYYAALRKAGLPEEEAIRRTRIFAWVLKNADRVEIVGTEYTLYNVPKAIFKPLDPLKK